MILFSSHWTLLLPRLLVFHGYSEKFRPHFPLYFSVVSFFPLRRSCCGDSSLLRLRLSDYKRCSSFSLFSAPYAAMEADLTDDARRSTGVAKDLFCFRLPKCRVIFFELLSEVLYDLKGLSPP